jgi:hypothetical protein
MSDVRTRVYSDQYGAIYRVGDAFELEYRDYKGRDTGDKIPCKSKGDAMSQIRDFRDRAKRIDDARETVDSWMRSVRHHLRTKSKQKGKPA